MSFLLFSNGDGFFYIYFVGWVGRVVPSGRLHRYFVTQGCNSIVILMKSVSTHVLVRNIS
jgi:hypothetical protein